MVSHAGVSDVSQGGMVKISIYGSILSHAGIANVSVASQGGMVKVSNDCSNLWCDMLVLQRLTHGGMGIMYYVIFHWHQF